MKKKVIVSVIVLATGFAQAQELSTEQQSELTGIGIQYAQKASLFEGMMEGKLTELELELTREGRLDTEEAADAAAKQVNTILKDMGGLYGEFIKSRVAFLLEAKNVLTEEQKLYLLQQLEPEALMDYEEVEFLQPEIFDLPINLSMDQRRKLVRLEADLTIKEVKVERDVELVLLDLEAIFLADAIDPAKVDKQVMKLADLAADAINNRVDFFIESKDVLTLEQKRMLSYLMGLD
jgi:Spy/CpxP family protein refolding chaperone